MGEASLMAARYTRAERLEQIRWRRERGMTYREIATDLGLTLKGVRTYVDDPDGSKARARKQSYRGTCADCGATTDGSNGRANAPSLCAACFVARQHDARHWTRDRIIAAFQRFAAFAGRAPAVLDSGMGLAPSQRAKVSAERVAETEAARAAGIILPHPAMVKREFGSWRAAVEAAGLTPLPTGSPSHRHRQETRRVAA